MPITMLYYYLSEFLFYFRAFLLLEIVRQLYVDGHPIRKMDLISTYNHKDNTLSLCSQTEAKEKKYSCSDLLLEQL